MHEHEPGERRFGAAAQAAEWDARYGERDGAIWSGRPNGRLVAEVADLSPGLGARHRLWRGRRRDRLARRGWTVTTIDVSDVAVGARKLPSGPVRMSSGCVGTLCGPPFLPAVDLLSIQYPALPKAAGEAAMRTLLDTVRPGGLLLAVYHDLDDEHREHMKSRGFDPADYVGADDLRRLLGDDFTVELYRSSRV